MKQSFYIAAAAFALVLASPISANANSFLKMTPDEDELAAARPICCSKTKPMSSKPASKLWLGHPARSRAAFRY